MKKSQKKFTFITKKTFDLLIEKNHNPQWYYITDNSYRIFIIRDSRKE